MKRLVNEQITAAPTNKEIHLFVSTVLSHYKKQGRHDLPWRKKTTPYRVLVSEMMLQQTQVGRVLPKFIVWMKVYPTLTALGKASFKDLLVLWQGLGYQRRVKALHLISAMNINIPSTFEALCALPGVGRYTASALCAFAYDQFGHPLLETNIRTALIEFFYKEKEEVADTLLYEVLFLLEKNIRVKKIGARQWYYAFMDYGAHLKQSGISHNSKSSSYTKQTSFTGSLRQLRAQTLFAILHKTDMPQDNRIGTVLEQLEKEKFIRKERGRYSIV